LPPPVNGATNANKYLFQSVLLREQFNCRYINSGLAKRSDDFGTVRLGKFFNYFKAVFKLLITLLFKKNNLVYITIAPVGPAFLKDSLFVFISKLFRKKTIIHLHGKGIDKKARSGKFWKIYYRLLFKNTHVICLSEKLIKDITFVYDKQPFIVPNGIPVVDYDRIKVSTPVKPIVLYLSNLYIRKGVLDFVNSIEKLKKTDTNFEAWIVGNSTVELSIDELKKEIVSKNLQDLIEVKGPKYGKEKYEILKQASVLVFPTAWPNEAFPIVNLEAMNAGLPIISTPEGGIPDQIIDGLNGFLVPKDDHSQIAEKINTLLSDSNLYKNMAENNRKKFHKFYTLESFEKNIAHVFHTILNNSEQNNN
jgi:glycosyltransferase involved in cell wall biosynthesis